MNDQEIFTSEDLKENDGRKRELIKLVASGEAVLIVGAGSSVRVDYVDWSELLKKLEDLAIKCGNGFVKDDKQRENDPLGYAENIKTHIVKKNSLPKYYALLCRLFGTRTTSLEFHKDLVSLPFRGILTTNYDMVLETALNKSKEKFSESVPNRSLTISEDSGQVHDFFMEMSSRKMPQRIAHLHGSIDSGSVKDIILSRKDYEKAYGQKNSKWTLHRKLLWAVLATRRVVFIGFSMNDPYLNEMLEVVSEDLWRWDQSIHFAIMSISPDNADVSKAKAVRLREDYGIDTVFYENSDGKHSRLDHLIYEIKAFESQSTTGPPQNQSDRRDHFKDQKPKPNEDESQDVLGWMEQVNERMERGINDNEN